MHLSDLHIGKRVNEFSMLEDQRYILEEVIKIIEEEKTQGVIIAGDVYDKTVPSAEAVKLLDWFLEQLVDKDQTVYITSGNHDSPERLAFGSHIMKKLKVHISPVYNGAVEKVEVAKGVSIFLLPFVKPQTVRPFFPEEEILDYNKAVELALSNAEVCQEDINILVAHQFVTGASTSESEEVSVGGMDNVDASKFDQFDYVALGHIHGPQKISRETIRYCGTPLKYSFSEANHKKSVTILEIDEERKLNLETKELTPQRDMEVIKGEFAEVMEQKSDNYVQIILTDEDEIINGISQLRLNYPNIMKMNYDNTRTRGASLVEDAIDVERKSPLELFSELYKQQNSKEMEADKELYIKELIESIWGE